MLLCGESGWTKTGLVFECWLTCSEASVKARERRRLDVRC